MTSELAAASAALGAVTALAGAAVLALVPVVTGLPGLARPQARRPGLRRFPAAVLVLVAIALACGILAALLAFV